ncbi:MAG: 40s ribosomal protein L44e [Pycnora praestabilis]|nr:MAG: 40s ribosomal protein L44e [Pycnora praestabilis]
MPTPKKKKPEEGAAKSKKPPPKSLYDTIIFVDVGKSKRRFGIHKGLLSYYSTYFNSAINGNFMEAQTGIISLPDDEEDIFEIFNSWLYTGKVRDDTRGEDEGHLSFQQLTHLYVFGDSKDVVKLRNAVIDELLAEIDYQWSSPCKEIIYIYENTAETSMLRKFFIDFYIWGTEDLKNSLSFRQDAPRSFLWDLLFALDLRPGPRNPAGAPYRKNPCERSEKQKDLLQGQGEALQKSSPSHFNSAESRPPQDCRCHTQHKVTQYKAGKASLFAQGKRRYDRKQSGYGGQTKPVFHKKAKTTKKVVLRLECLKCKTKSQLALKRCKHFELGGDKKTKGAALVF